jgi:threonine dehydrogenase-like Zn-dependent dehydrogenase
MYSHCRRGGWILGNTINGTQAEYVLIPHADGSLYSFPSGADEEAMAMLSDILPTGFECGVLNGQVKPGDTVAIVGAGPVGLAVLLTAQFYSPTAIFMIDLDDKRLAVAKKLGATTRINSADGHAAHRVLELTEGTGVDVAIEAVGLPGTFDICQGIVAAGGPTDGASVTPPPFIPGNQPGDYQFTPPNFGPADFTQWPQVTPFALARADEFRPGPPPPLASEEYTRVFNEV